MECRFCGLNTSYSASAGAEKMRLHVQRCEKRNPLERFAVLDEEVEALKATNAENIARSLEYFAQNWVNANFRVCPYCGKPPKVARRQHGVVYLWSVICANPACWYALKGFERYNLDLSRLMEEWNLYDPHHPQFASSRLKGVNGFSVPQSEPVADDTPEPPSVSERFLPSDDLLPPERFQPSPFATPPSPRRGQAYITLSGKGGVEDESA